MNNLWKTLLDNPLAPIPTWVFEEKSCKEALLGVPDWDSFPRIDPNSSKYHPMVHAELARYEWNVLKTPSSIVNAETRLYNAFHDMGKFPGFAGLSWLEMACYFDGWKAADAGAHLWRREPFMSWKNAANWVTVWPNAIKWIAVHDWRPHMPKPNGDDLLDILIKKKIEKSELFTMWLIKQTHNGKNGNMNDRSRAYDALNKHYPEAQAYWHIGWTMQECPLSMFKAWLSGDDIQAEDLERWS